MNRNKTKKFIFSRIIFQKAIKRIKTEKKRKWLESYFPFKEVELDLPSRESTSFNSRDWIEPIWNEYIKSCNTISEKPTMDPWRLGFTEFFGTADFEFLEKIEEILEKEQAFPGELNLKADPPPSKKEPPEVIKEEGWVYVVRNQDLHKIGITKDLFRRMRQLKADDKGNELIDAIKSDRYKALERTFHKIFEEKRIPQSEYFRLNPIQVKELQRMMRKEISSS